MARGPKNWPKDRLLVDPIASNKLIASGITTRIAHIRKKREKRQFRRRVLAEKTPHPSNMSKKNIIQLSAKHHENIVRATKVWRYVASSIRKRPDFGVWVVGRGKLVSSMSLGDLAGLLGKFVRMGVPGVAAVDRLRRSV